MINNSLSRIGGPIGGALEEFIKIGFATKSSKGSILNHSDVYKDAIEKTLIKLFPECATCQERCGCIQCGAYLPCTCQKPKCQDCGWIHPDDYPHLCKKCGTFPCPCTMNGLTSNWFVPTAGTMPIYQTINTNAQNTINYATQSLQNLQLPCGVCNQDPCICARCTNCNLRKSLCDCLSSPCMTCNQILCNCTIPCSCAVCSVDLCKTCNIPTVPALTTGPQFYNPGMLSRGDYQQKLARQKAIQFRNQMLGESAKDLYSPQGLQIPSKKWPGRIYVAYAHHVSLQVYDRGVNVGRLDVHTDNYDVPMGDVHLAAILKVAHDEEDMIRTSSFSPVRDI